MDPVKLTKLLKHLTLVNIQWEVEWWRIEVVNSNGFKGNCVPLVGLHHCLIILHVALHDNLVTVKGYLVAMVLIIP